MAGNEQKPAAPAIITPAAPPPPSHPVDASGAPAFPKTATPPSKPATGTDTVTVACKYGPGIVLRAFVKTRAQREVLGGGIQEYDLWEPTGETFTIRGPIVNPAGYRNAGALPEGIFGGYALTAGVPRDLWECWLEQNKHSDLVKNRLVFASGDYTRAMDEARELKDQLSGIEPLDPAKPGARSPELRGAVRPSEHAPGARHAA